MERYARTRPSRAGLVCSAAALACLLAVLPLRTNPRSALAALAFGAGLAGLACCCATTTVRDEGDHLWIGSGPLPLRSTRVPYALVEGVTFGRRPPPPWPRPRSRWGRGPGWVELRLRRRGRVRIGSDDPARLAALLGRRAAAERPG